MLRKYARTLRAYYRRTTNNDAYDRADPWPHSEVERSNTCQG